MSTVAPAPEVTLADYVVLGPIREWTSDHEGVVQIVSEFLGATVIPVGDGRVAARLPVAPIDGVNRWRWLAAALLQPSVTLTSGWRDAAVGWVPTSRAGTIRMLSAQGWTDLVARRP